MVFIPISQIVYSYVLCGDFESLISKLLKTKKIERVSVPIAVFTAD